MYVKLLHNIFMYKKRDAIINYIIETQVKLTIINDINVKKK